MQFLGAQRIDIGNEVVTPEAERLFAMIVRLSVPLGRMTSRLTMMDTLWPGSDESNARHNLRQTVYKAREIGLIVESGEDGLRLDPRHWSCDWDDPIGDVSGEWLPDYEPEFSDELRGWVTAQRIGVHALIRPRIIRALQTARSAGELVLADRYAVQLLDIDTLNEEATLTRAELMAMQGAKFDALRLLDAYLAEIGRVGTGKDAALPAQLLRRRIAEKLPAITYQSAGKHHGPLIGRQRESKRLIASLFDARAGRGGAILVQGPDGSGKTRLLFEVKKSACLQGMRVVETATDTTPSAIPFTALRGVVARLLGLPGAMGVSPEALAVLRAWLSSNEFAPDDCPTFEIEDLLASVSEETPMMLLYEHADRMDSESLDQLDRVYRRGVGRHHMLILTSATHATPTESPVELQWIERVALRPMTAVDVRSIVTAWAAAELPRAKQDQIGCAAVFAEGVPMYGIEMLGLMLDSGSPDVIPWRVKNAVDRAIRELSELQWRVLALCGLLGASARQSVVAASLKVEEMELARALDGLEAFGYVQCEDGVLRASGLMADAARERAKDAVVRLDAAQAAQTLLDILRTHADIHDLYSYVRAEIAANQEQLAYELLDARAGNLVRSENAEEIVFELGRLRAAARSKNLRSRLDSIVTQVLEGSRGVRRSTSHRTEAKPSSLPSVPSGFLDAEYTLSVSAPFVRSLAAARDVASSPVTRLSEATVALFLAFNLGEDQLLSDAHNAVNAVRYAKGVQPFDLYTADLMYFSSRGDRERALSCASLLADEARRVTDVSVACRGFRNAAEANWVFGDHGSAQAYLHESRQLASNLSYAAQKVWADLALANLSLVEMDVDGSEAYLLSANREVYAHNLQTPLLTVDVSLVTCWTALLKGDAARAAKACRMASRAAARPCKEAHHGVFLWALQAMKLATRTGKFGREAERDFASLRSSIGKRKFYSNEQLSLAALLLTTRNTPRFRETASFVASQFTRIEASGRPIWPFVSTLLEGSFE